jgi:rubrerythrin
MAYKQETLAALTTALSGNIELYNEIINNEQTHDADLATKETELTEVKTKLKEAEERGQQYLGQISNLLSKIPVGKTETSKTAEQKIDEIKNRKWEK